MRTSRGTIFKRGKKGYYYLRYWLNDKEIKVALKNEDGKPITRKEDAEIAAKPYRDVVQATRRSVQLKNIQDAVATADMKLEKLQEEQRQKEEQQKKAIERSRSLQVKNAWRELMSPKNRLAPQRAPSTLTGDKQYWMAFAKWLGVHAPEVVYMRDITVKHVNLYLGELEQGRTSVTFNHHLGFLTWFFDRMAPLSKSESNPFRHVERKKIEPPFKREAFTADELRSILKTAAEEGGELGMLIWVGACTGLRLGDAVTLKWNDIDLKNALVHRTTRKTHTNVLLGIPDMLGRLLSNVPSDKRTGYLFPQLSAKYLTSTSKMSSQVSAFFRRCGFETNVKVEGLKKSAIQYGFHSLRHALATLLGDTGVTEKAVQQALGHSNAEMTRYYEHDTARSAHAVASEVDRMLDGILSDTEPLRDEAATARALKDRVHELVEQLSESALIEILDNYGSHAIHALEHDGATQLQIPENTKVSEDGVDR